MDYEFFQLPMILLNITDNHKHGSGFSNPQPAIISWCKIAKNN